MQSEVLSCLAATGEMSLSSFEEVTRWHESHQPLPLTNREPIYCGLCTFWCKTLASVGVTKHNHKPELSTWLDTTRGQWEICFFFCNTGVYWCGFNIFPDWVAPQTDATVHTVIQSQWQCVRISAVHSEHVKQQYWANGCVPVGCFTINRRVAKVLPFTNLGADNMGKESRQCHSSPVTPAPVPNGCCWFNWLETGPLKQNRVRASRWECYRDKTRWYNRPLVYSNMADVTFREHSK